jgi:hypothetical protein
MTIHHLVRPESQVKSVEGGKISGAKGEDANHLLSGG